MNKMVINTVFATTLVVAFAICLSAQDQKPPPNPPGTPAGVPPVSPCPKLEVHSTTPVPVKEGRPVKFTATLSGGDAKVTPIYIWTTTAGSIVSGQATGTLEVDSSGAGAEKTITASILIGGFPGECKADASTTIQVIPPARKIDEYGPIREEEETARLDSFAGGVGSNELAFVITYAGRTSPRGQSGIELRRIRTYLAKVGISPDRVGAIDGGFKEEVTHELWIVPIGADTPRPTPTIAAKDIVYPKPTLVPAVKKP